MPTQTKAYVLNLHDLVRRLGYEQSSHADSIPGKDWSPAPNGREYVRPGEVDVMLRTVEAATKLTEAEAEQGQDQSEVICHPSILSGLKEEFRKCINRMVEWEEHFNTNEAYIELTQKADVDFFRREGTDSAEYGGGWPDEKEKAIEDLTRFENSKDDDTMKQVYANIRERVTKVCEDLEAFQ